MNFKKLLLCMSVAGMVASCTSDIDLCDVEVANEQGESEITIKVAPFVCDNDAKTRADLFLDLEKTILRSFDGSFTKNDRFGIFSLDNKTANEIFISTKRGYIEYDYVDETDDFEYSSLTFNTNKEKYVGDNSVIFFPYYKGKNVYVMDGKLNFENQTQDGDDNMDHLMKYTYYVSDPISIEKGEKSKDIVLRPLNSIVVLNIDLPAGEYEKIELENYKEYPWTTHGNFCSEVDLNVTSDGVSPVSGDLIERKGLITLNLENCDFDEYGTHTFYLSVYPTALSRYKVKVTMTDGRVFYANRHPYHNLFAGCFFVLDCSVAEPKYEAVDLELPSGTLWANMNVGANKPTDLGYRFAWGETLYRPEIYEEEFTWDKYVAKDYDGKTLDEEHDVARKYFGDEWGMPTYDQVKELIENTTSKWYDNYNDSGVSGRLVTSVKNGNSIFFPANGLSANYWTRNNGFSDWCWSCLIGYKYYEAMTVQRHRDCFVRPVTKK